jgi:hypothetical protein
MVPRGRTRPAIGLALVLAATGAAAGAGCGGESSVAKLEHRLQSELSAQLAEQSEREAAVRAQEPGAPGTPTVGSVDCPDGSDTDPGTTLHCRVLDEGGAAVGTLSVFIERDGSPSWQFTAAVP